jgi:hypothetical protein
MVLAAIRVTATSSRDHLGNQSLTELAVAGVMEPA